MEGDGRKPSGGIWWLWTRMGVWCWKSTASTC